MAHRAHLTPELAAALGGGPREAFSALTGAPALLVHARSRTTDTSVVELPGIGRVVRKRWNWPRRRDRLKGAMRTTWGARCPAQREFDALERLVALASGPFAPQPLAWAEERVSGVLRACILLVSEVGDAADLATWLVSARAGRARTQTLELLARRVREMHDAGLADFEMHPRNVLVASDGGVLKVDCAKQRVRARGVSVADRAADLAALDVGLSRLASGDERERFFRAYGTTPRLHAAVARELRRIDARESRRLPV